VPKPRTFTRAASRAEAVCRKRVKIARVLDYRDAPPQQRVHRALGVIRVDVERVDADEGGAGVDQELGGGAGQEGGPRRTTASRNADAGRVQRRRGRDDGAIRARLQWLYTRGSALLGWVQDDARTSPSRSPRTSARRLGASALEPAHL
jgi:hypothetical protein